MKWRFTLPLLLSTGSWRSGPLGLISKAIPTVEASQVDDNLWTPASGSLSAHTINSPWIFPAFEQDEARVYDPQSGTRLPTPEIIPPIDANEIGEIGTIRLYGRQVGAAEFILADELNVSDEVPEQTSNGNIFSYETTSGEPKILVNVSMLRDSDNPRQVFYLNVTTTSADSSELISPAFGVAPEDANHEDFFLEDLGLLMDEPAVPADDASEPLTEPGSIPTGSGIPKGLDETANDNNAPENTASTSTEDVLIGLDTAEPDSSEENKDGSGPNRYVP